MKIVSVGEITIDHYLNLNRSFVGGISLNFAIHAKRAGAEQVSLVSRVGTGEDGRRVLSKLAVEGVDASHVIAVKGKTAQIDIENLSGGERIFPEGGFHRNVLEHFQLSPADQVFIRGHDILVTLFEGFRPGSVFDQLTRQFDFEGTILVDFGPWPAGEEAFPRTIPLIKAVDLAFISGDHAVVEALLPLSRQLATLIVVTMGPEGSAALVDGHRLFQPAEPVPLPLDSTGCGDAFQAAFCVAYFRTGDIRHALQQGAAQAAAVLQHYGASG
jgi:fructoselysine 6-kinase